MSKGKNRKLLIEMHKKSIPLLFGKSLFKIKDPLPDHINLGKVAQSVANYLKPLGTLFQQLDGIYVGEFDFLLDREVNAMYHEGSIFVTNYQMNEKDMIDDIVHEFGHFVEENHFDIIYGDGMLEREFLGKRKKLYFLLDERPAEGDKAFFRSEFDVDFDEFLYHKVGYHKLSLLANGLFPSSYSITSLREYYAIGFEYYFMDIQKDYLRKICPVLYQKLIEIEELYYEFF